MTEKKKLHGYKSKALSGFVSAVAIFLLLSPSFLFPKEISEGVLKGIRLCVFNVIPSVFPFFVIADAVSAFSGSIGDSVLGKLFEKTFHLPRAAVSAFFLGNICGFPIGVKCASELYQNGTLTKKEAELLIGFSNNPSFAFVVTAVGIAMLGSFKMGIVLYFTVLSSAALTGFSFRGKYEKSAKTPIISKQKFDFVTSVKSAGLSSITVSSYIIFFSALAGLFIKLFGDGLIGIFFVSLSEVSGAALFITSNPYFGKSLIFSLLAAALSFSGFSVHLQARSIAAPQISFKKYYIMKVTSAFISAALAFCIAAFIFY